MMARLEEICAINMGQSPDSSTYNEDGNGLPFFQGNADFGEIYPAVRMWCSEPTKIAREKIFNLCSCTNWRVEYRKV